MSRQKLTKEQEKLWVKIYWSLIKKGLTHVEAFTLAENKFRKKKFKIVEV